MSILNPVPRAELARNYTHYGWFCGCVPVYIGPAGSPEGALVTERNWVPYWWFSVVLWMYGICTTWHTMLHPEYEPQFPILITGEMEHD